MKSGFLISHGCWAGIAVAAYLFGGSRDDRGLAGDPGLAEAPGVRAARVLGDGVASRGAEVAVARDGRGTEAEGRGYAAGDWESLARGAVLDSNPVTRRLAFGRLLGALTAQNAMAMRERLVEYGLGGDEWRDFNYAWGALAGEEAVLFAASSEEQDLEAALGGWASANPDEAIAFLDRLPEEMRDQRDRYAATVAGGLADRDRGMAADFVYEFANGGGGGAEKLMDLVARKALRGGDFRGVAAWSESLPDGSLKGAAMGRVADLYAKRDPEGAARWAGQFAERDYAARVIEEVGDGWAERDPVAAVGWLESLPAGGGQVAGLTSVFGDWEDRDPLAASEYLLSMPQSAKRDSAISGFSRGYAWQDPEAAITWAQDIGDPQLRQETLTRAGQAYMRRQPDSALVWLEGSGLPAEAMEQILETGRRR